MTAKKPPEELRARAQDLVHELWTIEGLSTLTGRTRDWVGNRVRPITPDGRIGKANGWRLDTFVRAVESFGQNKNKKPKDLKDYYDAQRAKDELEKSRSNLFERGDVVRFLAEQNTEFRRSLESFPDIVDRECEPGAEVVETIERLVEDLINALHESLTTFTGDE